MTLISELKEQWMKNPVFKAEYDALEDEFSLARELIEARTRAGLSQAELAQRMGTTQSAIARLESGKTPPSMRTIARIAAATGTRAVLRLEPRP
ncbi:helix-turn-helix transcriptional regulator [Acidithiobacillus ferriphilus]|uniref:helix-turn-helix domain-containing protein n=1 Tax=Acidithiobacillus ferriphilus TaxID=1689834 RepID=UPI001D0333FA|nr:helix-turn-helix transcriptional regulator [Acidithiobacillus ferriphilus]MBU2845067.1 helix-turn-helix transcriptional regulator [Acidithiobacillus ferriphilus]MBU2848153.1 helix-turn-helix transcriptional regulator [Acidithiobacillus ferriphilus]